MASKFVFPKKEKTKSKKEKLPSWEDLEDDSKGIRTRGGDELIVEKKKLKKKLKKHVDPKKDEIVANENNSIFYTKLIEIRAAAKKHNHGEQAILVTYKALFDMVCELIPIAEANYRQYKIDKSAYALNVYINQAREIANDMRKINNYEEQVRLIIELCRRQYTLIAQNLVEEADNAKRRLAENAKSDKDRAKVHDVMGAMTRSHAKYLKESLDGFTKALTDLLLEKRDTKPAHSGKVA